MRFVFEICPEVLKFEAEVGNLARCGVIDLVCLLLHQPAHVAWRECSFAIDLLRNGFLARVKHVERHDTLDTLVHFLVVLLVAEAVGGFFHE